MIQLYLIQRKSVHAIYTHTYIIDKQNILVTLSSTCKTWKFFFFLFDRFGNVFWRRDIYRLSNFCIGEESLWKFFFQVSPVSSGPVSDGWKKKRKKDYNYQNTREAKRRHFRGFLARRNEPVKRVMNYITQKSSLTPGSTAHVSVVTVKLVRRQLPAAVRRAASRATGKTKHHHLHQLYCTMKLLAIPPSLDIRLISVILLVRLHTFCWNAHLLL